MQSCHAASINTYGLRHFFSVWLHFGAISCTAQPGSRAGHRLDGCCKAGQGPARKRTIGTPIPTKEHRNGRRYRIAAT
jgi:hypothetical protein